MSALWKCVIVVVVCLGITACVTNTRSRISHLHEVHQHVIDPCTAQAVLNYAERTGMSVEGAKSFLNSPPSPLYDMTARLAARLTLAVQNLSPSDRLVAYDRALPDCVSRASRIH